MKAQPEKPMRFLYLIAMDCVNRGGLSATALEPCLQLFGFTSTHEKPPFGESPKQLVQAFLACTVNWQDGQDLRKELIRHLHSRPIQGRRCSREFTHAGYVSRYSV